MVLWLFGIIIIEIKVIKEKIDSLLKVLSLMSSIEKGCMWHKINLKC
jgi:hypothetical protein